jgi:hypothetical protein
MQMEARSKELNKGNWSGKRIAGIEERIARFNLTRGGIERLVDNMAPSPVFFDGDAL